MLSLVITLSGFYCSCKQGTLTRDLFFANPYNIGIILLEEGENRNLVFFSNIKTLQIKEKIFNNDNINIFKCVS